MSPRRRVLVIGCSVWASEARAVFQGYTEVSSPLGWSIRLLGIATRVSPGLGLGFFVVWKLSIRPGRYLGASGHVMGWAFGWRFVVSKLRAVWVWEPRILGPIDGCHPTSRRSCPWMCRYIKPLPSYSTWALAYSCRPSNAITLRGAGSPHVALKLETDPGRVAWTLLQQGLVITGALALVAVTLDHTVDALIGLLLHFPPEAYTTSPLLAVHTIGGQTSITDAVPDVLSWIFEPPIACIVGMLS